MTSSRWATLRSRRDNIPRPFAPSPLNYFPPSPPYLVIHEPSTFYLRPCSFLICPRPMQAFFFLSQTVFFFANFFHFLIKNWNRRFRSSAGNLLDLTETMVETSKRYQMLTWHWHRRMLREANRCRQRLSDANKGHRMPTVVRTFADRSRQMLTEANKWKLPRQANVTASKPGTDATNMLRPEVYIWLLWSKTKRFRVRRKNRCTSTEDSIRQRNRDRDKAIGRPVWAN